METSSILENIGLTKEETLVYKSLLKSGPLPAGSLPQKTGLSRPLIYKVLTSLLAKKLVEKNDDTKVARFMPVHPSKLREMLEEREKELSTAKASLAGVLGSLTSDFNLFSGRPNVQFYEGLQGMQSVIDDSLSAKEEIYSYADGESVVKFVPEINAKYVADREKRGILKKVLMFDTALARKAFDNYHETITQIRFTTCEVAPFQTVMQIYDGKISYITLSEKHKIGVIIDDANIYKMHRFLFTQLWNLTPPLQQ